MKIKVDTLGEEALYNCCKTSMSSKLIGSESDFFAKLVVKAVKSIETKNWKGKPKYPINCINIIKMHGRSSLES
jgi:T-complex protein 1 subunit alpha